MQHELQSQTGTRCPLALWCYESESLRLAGSGDTAWHPHAAATPHTAALMSRTGPRSCSNNPAAAQPQGLNCQRADQSMTSRAVTCARQLHLHLDQPDQLRRPLRVSAIWPFPLLQPQVWCLLPRRFVRPRGVPAPSHERSDLLFSLHGRQRYVQLPPAMPPRQGLLERAGPEGHVPAGLGNHCAH